MIRRLLIPLLAGIFFDALFSLNVLASTSSDDDANKRIDAIFSRFQETDSPGCAVAVVRNGRSLLVRGYGMANLEQASPITPSTVFDVGSMAKQFTAMCIVLLVEQGKLSLSDEVRKYVPELPVFQRPITIAHLVYHTSGLREQHDLLRMAGWRWEDLVTEADILDLVSRQRELNFLPGEDYLYSNTNYVLLSIIVKRVSGRSLPEFADKEIFRPLAMASTRFLEDHSTVVKRRAAGHVSGAPGPWVLWSPAFDFVGSTSLYTTVEDLARWDENFYSFRVGGERARELMLRPGRLSDGTELVYAFGLELSTHRGLRVVSHSGSSPGYRCEMIRFPDQHFSVIVLCNLFDVSPTVFAKEVAALYLQREFSAAEKDRGPSAAPGAPIRVSNALLHSYAGLYWSEATASTHRFSVKGDSLQLETGEGPYSLAPISVNEFLLPVAPRRFTFTFLPPKPPAVRNTVVAKIAAQKPIEYVRVPDATQVEGDVSSYVGDYHSDELGVSWNLRARDGALYLQRTKFRERKLEQILPDVYLADLGTFQFSRNAGGKVVGFKITTERTRHLRFQKQ